MVHFFASMLVRLAFLVLALLILPTLASAQVCSAAGCNESGTWFDGRGNTWTLTQNGSGQISGTVAIPGCGTSPVRGNATPSSQNFLVQATPSCGPTFFYEMTNQANCSIAGSICVAKGMFSASGGTSGSVTWQNKCSVNFALSPYPDPSPTMNATFKPTDLSGNAMTLAAAGAACGFTQPWFNWQQTVEVRPQPVPINVCSIVPPTSTTVCGYMVQGGASLGEQLLCLYARSNPSQPLVGSWPDPPPGGGYTSETYFDDAFPFYLTSSQLSLLSLSGSLQFVDTASDPVLNPCLQTTYNFFPTAAEYTLTASLVGIVNGSPSAPLYSWTWHSTFDGTSGGIVGKNLNLADPGSGTGGASITSINGVVLPSAVQSSQVTTTASGLAYSRVSQTFDGTVTLTNISNSAVSGPLQLFFFGMPVTATLVNATDNLSGTPYLTVPAVASLAPGQSVTFSVQFKNPANAAINLTPGIYAGSIN